MVFPDYEEEEKEGRGTEIMIEELESISRPSEKKGQESFSCPLQRVRDCDPAGSDRGISAADSAASDGI